MSDMTCLADGYVVPASFEKTGLNLNEIIVGTTGCGKSMSNAYSRLLHTFESSVVVPIAKLAIRDKFARMFEERGYKVIDLDFAKPSRCTVGYDPMDYIQSDEDVIQVARNFIGGDPSRTKTGEVDPYWNDSATSVLAAEISLIRLWAQNRHVRPSFADVIELHRSIKYENTTNSMKTSIDKCFEDASRRWPGNRACELWKTVKDLSPKTASCIFSIVNGALDKIFSDSIVEMTKKRERIDFAKLGDEKTALFITTSPMNFTLQNYINVLYADMFRSLFEKAESNINYHLNVPVHIICDDFACGSRIIKFEDYISIFRAAGMSVTLLLQSESQLISMYGYEEATTIINNCDTYIYMGGMDIKTCNSIAQRTNRPLHQIMSLPLEKVIVFRRGSKPFEGRRYQTLEDPIYRELNERDDR